MRSVNLLRIGLWRTLTIVGSLPLVIAVAGSTALAGIGQDESASPAAPITFTGGTINQVLVVTENVAQTTTSTAFAGIPGATTTVTVPAGQTALIVARFTAESACSGGTGSNWCSVRILIGGVEASPVTGLDFAFDSTDASTETSASWESHSMERVRRVGAGTYPVTAQWATTSGSTTFRLDDWTLTVERAQP